VGKKSRNEKLGGDRWRARMRVHESREERCQEKKKVDTKWKTFPGNYEKDFTEIRI